MKKIISCLIFFLSVIFVQPVVAQNLFSNADFENYSSCPTNQGQVPNCNGWIEIVQSADYMNCAYTCWTTQQTIGAQSGTGYMGFATYGSSNASEALGQFLTTPLVTGVGYTITFWAKKTSSGFYSNNCSGVSFWGYNGNPASSGSQVGVCMGSMGVGATLLVTSPLVTNLEWQQYQASFTAPSNLDFVGMCVECTNCAEYIFVDNFIFLPDSNNFTFNNVCFGDSTQFQLSVVAGLDSLGWNFGDPSTGSQNFSPLQNPAHLFSSAGIFTVQVIQYHTSGLNDTLTNLVTVGATPVVNLGNDTIICSGQPFLLDAGNAGQNYLWNTNATTQTITAGATGIYWVTVGTGNCIATDSISITIGSSGILNLGNDTTLCSGQSLILNAANAGSTYLWSTTATTQTINVSAGGNYSVTVTNVCGTQNDDINILIATPPVYVLGNDTTFCSNFNLQLNAGNSGSNYLWSNITSLQTLNVNTAGTYWVNISNNCGTITDSIVFLQYAAPQVSLGNDTLYCSAFNRLLNALNAGSTYNWSTGNTTASINVIAAGNYFVNVSNACGIATDTISITQSALPVSLLSIDTLFCSNFSKTLIGGNNADSYLWSDGTTDQTITVYQAGTYWIQLNNICGTVSDTIHIIQASPPQVSLGNDSTFCGSFSISYNVSCIACNYLWSNNSVLPQVAINSSGVLIVQVSNLCGIAKDTVVLTEIQLPFIILPVDTMLCVPEGYQIQAGTNAQNILWSTGDTTFSIQIPKAGIYWADVSNSCGIDVDTITISKCPGEYIMPNAFSPNSDGKNDFLFPIRIGDATLLNYDIYNRWGQKVFTYADGDENWDGTYYDSPCAIGVYVYVVRYIDNITGAKFTLKGNATLLR